MIDLIVSKPVADMAIECNNCLFVQLQGQEDFPAQEEEVTSMP